MSTRFDLKDRHILITGASSGIGRECAISCSKMGAKVTIVARNKARLEETFESLSGKNHNFICQDISIIEEIEELVKMAVAKNGKIHGFVHAAGIELTKPFKLQKVSDIDKLMIINVSSGLEFCRIISKKNNLAAGCTSFIFISSIMGVVGNKGIVGYSLTKGAIVAAVKSLALELSSLSIRVNSISPGHIVDTGITQQMEQNLDKEAMNEIKKSYPLGLGSCIDVANATIFLLSEASKWITGTNLIVDGGYTAK